MSGTGSRSNFGMLRFVQLIKRYKPHGFTIVSSQEHIFRSTAPKFEHESLMHRGLQLVNRNSGSSSSLTQKLVVNLSKNNKIRSPPPAPPIPRFNISTWARWLVGSILSLLIPFWKQKWDKLKRIEGEAENVVEEVESVAEVVEKVATVTEKVSNEIAEQLPENGKLKETAFFVENMSNTIAHHAHFIKHLFDKVEEGSKIEATPENNRENRHHG